MGKIHDQVAFVVFGKFIPMHSDTGGRRQLRLYLVITEEHFVIAGNSVLFPMAETRPIALSGVFAATGLCFHPPSAGHHQEIQHVPDAGPAQMGVTETHD